ncbi:MAG: glycosyltransferase family 39 protein [Polyangiaceae bacterium]|nr:glycosyltransferase family 39 protein [Polyangiaceae bacterium]MCL4752700.1 glycosyltransferase family 39 protein [Myxococcales bacterium]
MAFVERLRAVLAREATATGLVAVLFAPVCWMVLLERWAAAGQASFPGHADSSFYFSLAKNLANGRGPVIDYIWHFWAPHTDLTHFGPDYWMPLPSLLIAAVMKLSAPSVVVAARCAVVASVALAALVWVFARTSSLPRWAALLACAAVFLALPVGHFSVRADPSLYYAVFVLGALTLGIRARDSGDLRLLFGAGLVAGAAHLSRNDGVLVIVSLAVAQLCWSPPSQFLRRLGVLCAGYALLLAPWLLLSFTRTGRLMPAHGALPFLVDYEDLFALPPGPSFSDLARAGLWDALLLRQRASLDRSLDVVKEALGVPLLALALGVGMLLGAKVAGRAPESSLLGQLRRTRWLLPSLYVLGVCFLHISITPVASGSGAVSRTLPAVLALVVVAAISGAIAIRAGAGVTVAAAALLLVWPWHEQAKGMPLRDVRENNAVAERLAVLHGALDREARCFHRPVVVMTREPWQLTELTGYRSIQIPNADLDTILATAKRYGVTHLMPSFRRRALGDPRLLAAFAPVPGVAGLSRTTEPAHSCP